MAWSTIWERRAGLVGAPPLILFQFPHEILMFAAYLFYAIATVLTLVLLPLLLSVSNQIKVSLKWLKTGEKVTQEEVERAIIESNFDHDEE